MQTIGIKGYDDKRGNPGIQKPRHIRHRSGILNNNRVNQKWNGLGDTEKLAVLLLPEIAFEYDNEIPYNTDDLQVRLGITDAINWEALFKAEEIYYPDKHNPNLELENRMKVVLSNWNAASDQCLSFVKVTRIDPSKKRGQAFKARCRDDYFWNNHAEALQIAVRSAYLSGESWKGKGWIMNFAFFIKSDTITKIMDGMYTKGQKKTWYIERDGKQQYASEIYVQPTDTVIDKYQGD